MAIAAKANTTGTIVSSSLSDTDLNAAAAAAAGKDVAIVFITADSGEAYLTVEGHEGDRNDLKAWHGGVGSQFLSSDCVDSHLHRMLSSLKSPV
ncbi:hypothetical protein DXG03_009118 [Asterophora parasitica]|uniref:Uncharacterized protein n=1 Tax=Asterophora parasitica TaxID=117018 RepID=A0A9P7KCF5_9AGAR|nr:hypothetical protein DXG03_009118 [Asterophora parasitica]